MDRSLVITPDLSVLSFDPPYRGALDMLDGTVLRGWVLSGLHPAMPVELEISLGEIVLTVAATSIRRHDLEPFVGEPVKAGFAIDLSLIAGPVLAPALDRLDRALSEGEDLPGLFDVRVRDSAYRLPAGPIFLSESVPLLALREAWLRARDSLQDNVRARLRQQLLGRMPATPPAPSEDVRAIAFYLPQYHPTPENDAWWGPGFTEWSNVASARPVFDGHAQPRLPADLGFYDLRLPEVQRQQVDLARRFGVSAFCYYYYWFSGTTMLTMPIDRHVEENLDLDFCLCWANENWSRRWDGSEAEVLMTQRHAPEEDIAFIHAVLPYMQHPRYIRVDGEPLLLVYRLSLMADPAGVIAAWKQAARDAGLPGLHVCMAETFGQHSPQESGADSACQFPPHGITAAECADKVDGLDPRFEGRIYSYPDMVARELRRPDPGYLLFRTAMPGWDNTARKGLAAHLFHGATPEIFEAWLTALCAQARRDAAPGRRLVFINAWNEWAEGAVLEPERGQGYGNLQAVRHALSPSGQALGEEFLLGADGPVGRLINANAQMLRLLRETEPKLELPSPFIPRAGLVLGEAAPMPGAALRIDMLNGRTRGLAQGGGHATLLREQPLLLAGWFRLPGMAVEGDLPLFVQLLDLSGEDEGLDYIASLHEHEAAGDGGWQGFRLLAGLRAVPPGSYGLTLLAATERGRLVRLDSSLLLHIG